MTSIFVWCMIPRQRVQTRPRDLFLIRYLIYLQKHRKLDYKKIKTGCTGRSGPKPKSCGQIHKKTPKVDFRRNKEKTFFAKVYDGICRVSFCCAVLKRIISKLLSQRNIEIQRRPSRPSWRRRHGEGKIERITSALSDCVSNV